MRKVCVIGARSGSKSIPNKNLQPVSGKSLLRLCVEKALSSGLFDKVYLSTDSEQYIQEVIDIRGIECVLRPDCIAADHSHEFEYLEHIIEVKDIHPQDIVARMQCTSPFQSIASMAECLNLLDSIKEATSVQLVTETPTSIYKAMQFDSGTKRLIPAHPMGSISPGNRQKFQKSYFRSNFYCFKVQDISKADFIGENSLGFIGEDRESIDIDNPFDLVLVRALAEKYPRWLVV